MHISNESGFSAEAVGIYTVDRAVYPPVELVKSTGGNASFWSSDPTYPKFGLWSGSNVPNSDPLSHPTVGANIRCIKD